MFGKTIFFSTGPHNLTRSVFLLSPSFSLSLSLSLSYFVEKKRTAMATPFILDPGHSGSDSDDSDVDIQIGDAVRQSRELARYSIDARKQSEYQGGPSDHLMVPVEHLRKSIDLHNRPGAGPGLAESDSDDEHDGARPRKSLEEHFDANDEEAMLRTFPISEGLTTAEAEARLKEFGKNELPDAQTPARLKFLKMLAQPLPP